MRVLALAIFAIAACSPRDRGNNTIPRDVGPRPDSGESSDGNDVDRDGSAPDGSAPDGGSIDGSDPNDASNPDADPVDASSPDSGPPGPPLCTRTCTGPSDCAEAANALQDADNYECIDGGCRYRGCLSTAECSAVFGASYVCVHFPSYPLPACVVACAVPTDCESPAPIFGADNYECIDGGCRWLGCNSAAECQMTFNDPTYVCEPQAGLPFNNCIRPCSAPTECAGATSPAFDADNYACNNARCEYLGCNNDAECDASFMSGSWECR